MHKTREKGLSASLIKLIAILAMTLDHIAWAFLPTEKASLRNLGFTVLWIRSINDFNAFIDDYFVIR